jgi:hypothetical protein
MTPLRIAARAAQTARDCDAAAAAGVPCYADERGGWADGGWRMADGQGRCAKWRGCDGCEGQPGQSSASTASAWARLLVAAIKTDMVWCLVVPALAAGNGRVSVHLRTSPSRSQPAAACPVPESGAFLHLPLKTPPALPSYPLPPPLIAAVLLALAAQSLILCPCRSFATTTLAVTHAHTLLPVHTSHPRRCSPSD